MLLSLSIKNYAIIENLDIDFAKGFSVITGETGAGKSIILGAMAMVLGQRAEAKVVQEGKNKCLVEATFDISNYDLVAFFDKNELDYDSSCIIRREVLSTGKSRSFINDTPVNLSLLKELSGQLIDIHSQHENLLLKDNSFQLKVVDIVAKNEKERKHYQELYLSYKEISERIERLLTKQQEDAANKEYIEYQLGQLQKADLKEGEKEDLEAEQKKLSNTEEIKRELERAYLLLSDESQGVLRNLKDALTAIRKLASYMSEISDYDARLNTAYIDLNDLSAEVEVMQHNIEFDPQRIEFINERLDLIYSLEQKHKAKDVGELLALQKQLELSLTLIDSADEQIELLQKQLSTIKEQMTNAAIELSKSRKKSAKTVGEKLIYLLNLLGMPYVRFEITVAEKENFTITGKDQIEFLFSANEKSALQPVAQIASGGEISRVMLGLKSILANSKAMPTVIFDEIDTGISGEVADKMAGIMDEMSEGMQVVCITHLPQIAAKGAFHYKVFKEESTSNIRKLSKEERVDEIAQMLSGAIVSDAAIENAKILLQ